MTSNSILFWDRYELSTYLWRNEWVEGLYDTFTDHYVDGLSLIEDRVWILEVRFDFGDGSYVIDLYDEMEICLDSYFVQGVTSFRIPQHILECMESDYYLFLRRNLCLPHHSQRVQ